MLICVDQVERTLAWHLTGSRLDIVNSDDAVEWSKKLQWCTLLKSPRCLKNGNLAIWYTLGKQLTNCFLSQHWCWGKVGFLVFWGLSAIQTTLKKVTNREFTKIKWVMHRLSMLICWAAIAATGRLAWIWHKHWSKEIIYIIWPLGVYNEYLTSTNFNKKRADIKAKCLNKIFAVEKNIVFC